MNKHTPGPWNIRWLTDLEKDPVIFAKDGDIAEVYAPFQKNQEEYEIQVLANAKLLVVAPDLLDIAKKAEALFRHYGDLHAAKPDMEKANRNYEMADELSSIINKTSSEL